MWFDSGKSDGVMPEQCVESSAIMISTVSNDSFFIHIETNVQDAVSVQRFQLKKKVISSLLRVDRGQLLL